MTNGAGNESTSDIGSWFGSEELTVCPECGEQRLVPANASVAALRMCLSCGLVPAPAES